MNDLISPFKAAMGLNYKVIEERIMRAVRFGLPASLPPNVAKLIKLADKGAAFHEATQLAGFPVEDACQYFGDPAALGLKLPKQLNDLEPLETTVAQAAYLERFSLLEGAHGGVSADAS